MKDSPKQTLGTITLGRGSGKPLASKELARLGPIEASELAHALTMVTN